MSNSIREFPLDDQMKKHKFSRVYANLSTKQLFVENGKASVTSNYTGELETTLEGLRQKLVETPEFEQKVIEIILKFLSAEWRRQSEEELADVLNDELELEEETTGSDGSISGKEEGVKVYWIHKFSRNIPLIESVIIDGKPFFIQTKDKRTLETVLLPEYRDGSKVYRPIEENADLGKPYVFKSKEEIDYYIKLASKITCYPDMNFDPIFKLVSAISKQYIVLPEQYKTLVQADVIYSCFVDMFATTHYDFFLGDNGAGKNAILSFFRELGYRVLSASGMNAANIYTFLGTIEDCQGTIAHDEADNLDNEHDTMNILKTGYAADTRVPKTDLKSGRVQEGFCTYGFKILASERSLDPAKARGFLDRCFEIPCLVGRPEYNVKKIREKPELYVRLKNEIERARKLIFACRMLYHGEVIEEVGLNIFNREAELAEPLIRLFQNSPYTLEQLKLALVKVFDAKRKVKSNSLEAVIHRALRTLISPKDEKRIDKPHIKEEPDAWIIGHSAIIRQVKVDTEASDTDERNMSMKDAFYCEELGGKVPHSRITKILRNKFRAEVYEPGITVDGKKDRALRLTKDDLDSKNIEYDVPDTITVGSAKKIPSGPDYFDKIILGKDGTCDIPSAAAALDSTTAVRTVRTVGTVGTVLGDKEGGTKIESHAHITSDIEREHVRIEPENPSAYTLEPSQLSQPYAASVQQDGQLTLKSYGIEDPIHGKSEGDHITNDIDPSRNNDNNIHPETVPSVPTVPDTTITKVQESSPTEDYEKYIARQKEVFGDIFSEEQESIFLQKFDESADEKHLVLGEKLVDELVSSGRFTTSDAANLMRHMKKEGLIEEVEGAYDVYRRVD